MFEWKTLAKCWMNRCSKKWINECRAFLSDVLDWIFPLVLNYIEKHGKHVLNPLKYNLINTTFNIIQMVIDDAIEINADDYQKFLVTWIQAAVIFAIAWGIGGILNDESRRAFDLFHKKVSNFIENYVVYYGNTNKAIFFRL